MGKREAFMKECGHCVFRKLDCAGTDADFVLEVIVHIRPVVSDYCALFDFNRIRAYLDSREKPRSKSEGKRN